VKARISEHVTSDVTRYTVTTKVVFGNLRDVSDACTIRTKPISITRLTAEATLTEEMHIL